MERLIVTFSFCCGKALRHGSIQQPLGVIQRFVDSGPQSIDLQSRFWWSCDRHSTARSGTFFAFSVLSSCGRPGRSTVLGKCFHGRSRFMPCLSAALVCRYLSTVGSARTPTAERTTKSVLNERARATAD